MSLALADQACDDADVPEMSPDALRLLGKLREAAAAEARVVARMDNALRAARTAGAPWEALAEATGLTVDQVRYRESHPVAERPPRTKPPRKATEPSDGLSLGEAAKALGTTAPTLSARIRKAAMDHPGQVIRLQFNGRAVEAHLPEALGTTRRWRIFL